MEAETENEKFNHIEKDVYDLKESMDILQSLVSGQQEPIDTIEDMIHDSKLEIKEAAVDLEPSNTNFYFVSGLIFFLYLIL